jgi:hypothetical protein
VLGFVPSLIEDRLDGGNPTRGQWLYWFEVAAGNWSPQDKPPVSKWAFALSAVLAVLLNNALFITVVSFLWRIWRTRMQLGQAVTTRDQMNKQALFEIFDPSDEVIREKINAAFRQGENAWEKNLP